MRIRYSNADACYLRPGILFISCSAAPGQTAGLWATFVTGDDDIRAILPELPPPAPNPRKAAISAALARFDGMPPAPVQKPRSEWTLWWAKLNRPQVGLIAAAAVVAAISFPFALQKPVPGSPVTRESTPPRAQDTESFDGQEASSSSAPISALEPPSEELNAVAGNQPIVPPKNSSQAERPIGIAQAAPAAPPSAVREDESAAIVVQGRAVTQNLQDVPLAVSAVSSEKISRDESAIVVTSSRKAAARPVPRGDWNACTVNDPRRTLTRCQKLASNAAKAIRSQAESYLSEGLQQAWDGQLDKAIEAFDAAIRIAPDLSAAYLNRGLIHDQQGNGEAAIADLNLAVRFSPQAARAYYNRSMLLRKYGELKRAQADEQRAIKLDARYEAILQ